MEALIIVLLGGILADNAEIPESIAELIAREVATVCAYHSMVEFPGEKALSLEEWISLTMAVIKVESFYNPMAKSPIGARGLMQINPRWWKVGRDDNIKMGVGILRMYYINNGCNLDKALVSYSGGAPGYVRKVKGEMYRWMKRLSI